MADKSYLGHLGNFIVLSGSSNTLREQDNISPDHSGHMPTYHMQQTWRAKSPKTVVGHDLENPPQPPKNEFAEGCSKSYSILKLEHFF